MTRARRVAATLALAVGLLLSLWSIGLFMAGGGFDSRLFGIRIRSNDPWRPAVFAAAALAFAWILRRRSPRPSLDRTPTSARLRRALPLILILAAAALVRIWALTFGFPSLVCRPDEEAVAAIAGGLYHGNTRTHFFTYPPLFMLAVAAGMRALDVTRHLLSTLDIHVGVVSTASASKFFIARILSASAGLATVCVVYSIASRLFDRRVALASAACLAFAFLHVRDSHFGVTDVPMTFMLLAAFLWIVKLSASGSTRDFACAALLAGLATATKYNASLVFVPAAFAILADPHGRPIGVRLSRVALFGAVMVLTFLVITPYAIAERQQLLAELRLVSEHLALGHGPNLGRGWTYHLGTTLWYGLGWPLLAAGLAGLALVVRRRPRAGLLIALFPVAYYVVAGNALTVFTRHMQPVVPFLCLTAGYALVEAGDWIAAALRRPAWRDGLAVIAVGLAIAPSAYAVVRFDQILARTDSRVLARRWIDTHFPPGTTVAQIGPPTGHVVSPDDREPPYARVELTANGPRPDLVIVQSSPLHGTDEATESQPVPAAEYDVRFALDVAAADPANVYDRQDDFYLPMRGFRGIARPGPNLRIYVRRPSPVR